MDPIGLRSETSFASNVGFNIDSSRPSPWTNPLVRAYLHFLFSRIFIQLHIPGQIRAEEEGAASLSQE